MKRFEKPSLKEFEELVHRLQGKTVENVIAMFGPPARERGPRTDERLADGVPWIVEIRRELMFRDIGPTIHRLVVTERADGKLELSAQGRRYLMTTPPNHHFGADAGGPVCSFSWRGLPGTAQNGR